MKTLIILTASLFLTLLLVNPFAVSAEKKIQVVATIADMADFAKQIGGDKVEVKSIFKGQTDAHFFEPLPSHVIELQKADILIVGGLEVDFWAKGLIDASRNPDIKFGKPGYIDPSDGIKPKQVPAGGRIDGSMGDVHPLGNPHYWFTPENVEIAVRNICKGLVRVDPENKDYYEANTEKYIDEVKRTFDELKSSLAKYKSIKIIQYHTSWDYFADAFGLEIVGSIEPKPGVPPTPSHLSQLVKSAGKNENLLILAEPYYPRKPIDFVVKNTSAKALRLHVYLGSKGSGATYLDNLRKNIESIAEAVK